MLLLVSRVLRGRPAAAGGGCRPVRRTSRSPRGPATRSSPAGSCAPGTPRRRAARAPPSRCACARLRTPANSPLQAVVVVQVVPAARPWHASPSGAGKCVPVARKWAISRKIHGRPAPRGPIMIASAPVVASTCCAFSGESMSPLATTGDAQGRLDRADGVVLGLALVALLARAAVHRHHRDAGGFGRARDAHRVALGGAPAGAHLQRDRHVARRARGDHGLDDRQRGAVRPASAPSPPTCCRPSWPGSPC